MTRAIDTPAAELWSDRPIRYHPQWSATEGLLHLTSGPTPVSVVVSTTMLWTAEAPRLATEVSERPGVQIFVWPDKAVTVDDAGFGVEGVAKVGWSEVVRIARGHQVRRLAAAGDFWAFRTKGSRDGYWIRTGNLWTTAFSREVRRRFPIVDAPPMKHWQDRDFSIRAYVVWPSSNLGEPLYVPVKRHWWSWRSRLAYNDHARGAG